ncbi:flagellar biosynthetic protein FlhB [Escherichia coli]|nr:flagellar biosynthetic protein FlhB [Escherichia coli]
MSDESDDKTEAPTPHRLEKAREEGQIPRSRELTSLLILLVGVSVIWFGGVSLARRLSGMLSAGLHFDHSIINDPNLILGQIILLIREAMLALLPLISGVVLVAIISPVMLGGGWYLAENPCSRSFPNSTRYRALNGRSRHRLARSCLRQF